MIKHYPKTFMTLAFGAMIATTGISPANANVGPQDAVNQMISISSSNSNNEATTPLKPGVTIPLIKQTSIIDRLASVSSQMAVIADPKAKLSFERPVVTSTPAPPDPAVLAKKKAEAEAKVAADAKVAAEAKATEEAKVAADQSAKAQAQAPVATPQANNAQATPAPAKAPTAAPQSMNALQQYASQALSSRGLNGPAEMTCLIPLWNHESGWNPNAANPGSTARGIPQIMMNVHFGANWQTSAAGVAYLTNPQVQIDKGLDYIMGRYGSPCNAWSVWQSQSWY